MSYKPKRWALYASSRGLGTFREHRLAGAHVGPVGATLVWDPMRGWQAKAHWSRLAFEVTLAPRRDDPRVQEWIAALMGHIDVNVGVRDANDGRLYKGMDDRTSGPSRPAESWKADDPQQPVGWHHDGQTWVQNDDGGWWRDRSGYWRYNAPGDPGWKERPDGSWRYEFANPDLSRQ